MAHAAVGRLALAVHEQVLGGVELEAQHVLVIADEREMNSHLGDLVGAERLGRDRRRGERAHLGDDRRAHRLRSGALLVRAAAPSAAGASPRRRCTVVPPLQRRRTAVRRWPGAGATRTRRPRSSARRRTEWVVGHRVTRVPHCRDARQLAWLRCRSRLGGDAVAPGFPLNDPTRHAHRRAARAGRDR